MSLIQIFWTDRLSHSAFSADVDENGDISHIKYVSGGASREIPLRFEGCGSDYLL